MKNVKRLKYACYTANLTMAIVANLSPILFLTFHTAYGISYSQLGLLILLNFVTQLSIDLIFSFYSQLFPIEKVVRISPLISVAGLLIYALVPRISPELVYPGLALGTIVFSLSSGLTEVLISPLIAAVPWKDPDREMSRLHSVYAWGVVFMIVGGTLFLKMAGAQNWCWMAVAFALVPALSAVLFAGAELPPMETAQKTEEVLGWLKNPWLLLSACAIFLGGASEVNMAQWSSGYLEQVLQIPKVYGDIFGVALFAVMMGVGRSLYARIGKNTEQVLLWGAVGAAACYLTVSLTENPVLAMLACALTGLCVSMLWPGNLIVMAKRLPEGGVFAYALMAAGGDLGASVVPHLTGVAMDLAAESPAVCRMAETMAMTPDQLAMKIAMLGSGLAPALLILVCAVIVRTRHRFL